MSQTNFPDGITSYGIPVLGGGGTIPIMGGAVNGRFPNIIFVDPANGNNGNTGASVDQALDQVSGAEDKTITKSGDTVYLLNDGGTGGTSREDSTITWDKSNVHLIGLSAPSVNQRSRISPNSSQTDVVTPQFVLSGDGCIIGNISFVEPGTNAAASTGLTLSGRRNYLYSVSILNMLGDGNDDAATIAGSEALLLDGANENTFNHCYIGADTIARTAANANIRCDNAATRILFEDCTMSMRATENSPLFFDAPGANDLDRWIIFKNCLFVNAMGSSATEILTAFVVSATANGMVLLQNSYVAGAAEWDLAVSGNVFGGMATSTLSGVTAGGLMDALTT